MTKKINRYKRKKAIFRGKELGYNLDKNYLNSKEKKLHNRFK